MSDRKTFVLGSFPRSGTNYFEKAWKQKTGENITVFRDTSLIKVLPTHRNVCMISTIKEPLPSIVSRTMIYFHEYTPTPMKETIEFSINDYKEVYKTIVLGASHIVDVSSFNNLDNIIDQITNKINKPIHKETIDEQLEKIPNYSKSFIYHKDYEKISRWVSEHDLSECNDLYWQAYSLSKYK